MLKSKKAIAEVDLSELIRGDKIKSKWLAKAIEHVIQLDKINKVYANLPDAGGEVFIEEALKQLNIKYKVSASDLKHIPKDGPFIVISNHPYGGIDGMILMLILLKQRPDFKMMVNYLLQQFHQLQQHCIAVNPFLKNEQPGINIKALKSAMHYLNEGAPIGIFPAGEVSAFNLSKMRIADKMWHPVVGKMIKKANVKVVPVYFSGNNSLLFNLLGLLNPALRTAKLPSELFNKNEEITVRIGKPVSVETLQSFDDSEQMLRFLRAKTYSLGSALDVKPYFVNPIQRLKSPHKIIEATHSKLMADEILHIKSKNGLLADYNELSVLVACAKDIPNILREISRLREITFREVGEGTNRSADIDEFDIYYKHLFVWNHQKQEIVGAYRIGEGKVLFAKFHKKGFYLNRLFKFDKKFNPIFKSSIELGRSFIVKSYQKTPFPLMLLWKGVNEFIKQNPSYKYLIGPVSISNAYSKLSKDLMVDYIYKHHFDKEMASYVSARKRYKSNFKGEAKELKKIGAESIRDLDQLITDIEPTQTKIPVLLKKYLAQNAKIIAFNVDPDFSNSLDGLLVLKLDDVPDKVYKMIE